MTSTVAYFVRPTITGLISLQFLHMAELCCYSPPTPTPPPHHHQKTKGGEGVIHVAMIHWGRSPHDESGADAEKQSLPAHYKSSAPYPEWKKGHCPTAGTEIYHVKKKTNAESHTGDVQS